MVPSDANLELGYLASRAPPRGHSRSHDLHRAPRN
jgi:hypothetical protein